MATTDPTDAARTPSPRKESGTAGGSTNGGAPPADPDVGIRAAEALESGEDVGALDARSLVGALGSAFTRSNRVTREGIGLAAELAKVTVGRSSVEPAKGDWRFKDPAWRENPPTVVSGSRIWPRRGRWSGSSSGRRARLAHRRAGAAGHGDPDQHAGAHEHAGRQPGGAQAGVRDRRRKASCGGRATSSATCGTTAGCRAGRHAAVHGRARTWPPPRRGRLPRRGLRGPPVPPTRRPRSARGRW